MSDEQPHESKGIKGPVQTTFTGADPSLHPRRVARAASRGVRTR